MGKYSGVTPHLPQYQQEKSHQDKVNEAKQSLQDTLPDLRTSSLVHAYVQQRSEVDEMKRRLKQGNLFIEALAQMLVDQMDDEDVTSVKIPGAAVRVQIEPYAQVRNKEAFRIWCIENGLETSLALPWSATNSITKERLLEGKPEPDGVEAFQKSKIVMTRDKSGDDGPPSDPFAVGTNWPGDE